MSLAISAKTAFRLGAVGLAALAIAVAVLQSGQSAKPHIPAPAPAAPIAQSGQADLQRCQALGAAGADDPGCLRQWELQRRRFLGLLAEKAR